MIPKAICDKLLVLQKIFRLEDLKPPGIKSGMVTIMWPLHSLEMVILWPLQKSFEMAVNNRFSPIICISFVCNCFFSYLLKPNRLGECELIFFVYKRKWKTQERINFFSFQRFCILNAFSDDGNGMESIEENTLIIPNIFFINFIFKQNAEIGLWQLFLLNIHQNDNFLYSLFENGGKRMIL